MKSITNKYWNISKKTAPSMENLELCRKLNISSELLDILIKRGFEDYDTLYRFLYPSLNDLVAPHSIKDMRKACEIIYQAIVEKWSIIIWGDYDVDGVTATCLLVKFFKYLGVEPGWFIPDRFNDGYGLSVINLEYLLKNRKEKNVLFITVDCGITNFEEVNFIKKNGGNIIVTDHHEPGSGILEADATINVKQKDCEFSDKDIAGVGTAFYLVAGLRKYLTEKGFFHKKKLPPNLKEYLDLVAVGTIADMVPLKNNNRILVRAGFEVINSHPSVGIAALLDDSDIRNGEITSDDIAFQIAPKINAAGRLETASLAVKLLLENDKFKAKKMAKKLSNLNKKRKDLCNKCLEYTLSMVDMYMQKDDCLFLLQIDCSIGVLGIVASQLSEKLRVPVILVAEIEDKKLGKILKGSCRSVAGVDLFASLTECDEYLIQYGGHKMAAGVTLFEKNLPKLRGKLSKIIRDQLHKAPVITKKVDIELDVEAALGRYFLNNYRLLEPFGIDNEKPVFCNKNSVLTEIRRVGQQGNHLIFRKRGKFKNHNCIGFDFGEFENSIKEKHDFNMIYTVIISRFKKAVKYQAKLIDLI